MISLKNLIKKMTLRNWTAVIIIFTFFILVIYDIYVFVVGGLPVTISDVYVNWSVDRPYLLVGAGYLLGHLTWPQRVKK